MSSLGLARKAGKLTPGTDAVCDAIRSHRVSLVLVSTSASDNTKKRISNCATFYKIPIEYVDASPDEIGAAIGKTAAACVGVADENFKILIIGNLAKPE